MTTTKQATTQSRKNLQYLTEEHTFEQMNRNRHTMVFYRFFLIHVDFLGCIFFFFLHVYVHCFIH